MSIYKGTELLAGVSTDTISNANYLLDFKWSDHIINSMEWLRADTFSWQNGDVYKAAYNHLVADYSGGTSQTETVGSYTITYVLADDGHKITTDETNVANIYNESGVAWYYVLDTANTRFKLPRENPAREELIQVIRAKGTGIALGLTNGSFNGGLTRTDNASYTDTYRNLYGEPVGTTGSGSSVGAGAYGITDDSTKSGIISSMTDSTSVFKGKKYLYFYVGQFSQSATEQTAGLNSELFNGKLDLDLGNASNTTKETIVGWGIPDYTAIVSITNPYTAPSNGFIKYVHLANQGLTPKIDGIEVDFAPGAGANYDIVSLLFPISKGSVFNFPQSTAKFIPCQGVN